VAEERTVIARRLAWGLFGLWVTLSAGVVAINVGAGSSFALVLTPALAGFAVVGALVASREPRNALGWLLLAFSLVFALANAIEGYVVTADEPAPALMWVDDWIASIWIGIVGIWVPLLFPDGRLPSPRWRPVAWFGTAAFAADIFARGFGHHVLDTSAPGTFHNPYALPGAAGDVLAALVTPIEVAFVPAVLGAMAGLVVRLRRSRGVERLQLKWFAYVTALMLAALLMAAVSLAAPRLTGGTLGDIGWSAFLLLVVVGLPATIGTAILRHRLYDIDVVINRTLVYGALTATLGATYLGLVLLIGLTVGQSNVAIAVSTLAVAALFRPARARIQGAVDRRFYRRRYDAARTLEAFGGRLREELDLEALRGEIATVVGETVQPAHVTLWLRSDP
jgi:hypothetical protein